MGFGALHGNSYRGSLGIGKIKEKVRFTAFSSGIACASIGTVINDPSRTPEDRPIPIDDLMRDMSQDSAAAAVTSAETAVLEAQDAIGRQTTDPYMTLPPLLSEEKGLKVLLRRRVAPSIALLLLIVGCVAAFASGWESGMPAARGCDRAHCRFENGGN